MQEFGLYTLKQSYFNDFGKIDPSLNGLKLELRPFVCIKTKTSSGMTNWLIPLASINPNKPGFKDKNFRYKTYQALERDDEIRAIKVISDITKRSLDPQFKTIIEYYNIIPVKHKYCSKYIDNKNKKHIVINDASLCNQIKKNFKLVLKEKRKGKEIGFIAKKIEAGEVMYKNYGKKIKEIGQELYKNHYRLIKENAQRKAQAQSDKTEKEINHIVKKEIATGKMEDAKKIAAIMSFKELDQPLRCYLCLPSEKFITKNEKEEDCVKIKVVNIKKPSLKIEKQIVPIKYLKTKMIGDGLFVTHVADQLITDFKFQLKQVTSSTKKVIIKK